MALQVSRNLALKLWLDAKMPISTFDQTVKHWEKGDAESHNCPQEPHGKPDFAVASNFNLRSGLHLGSNFPFGCLQGWGSQTL